MCLTLGNIHSLESFGSADGPGVRFLIFLQGCNMRCKYCHNPDTWSNNKGTKMTAQEVITKALRYKAYWKNNGGITVSGGEALLQIDFLIELFTLAKKYDIHTCIDTSGSVFAENPSFLAKMNTLIQLTDLFLLDIKHIDDTLHRNLTGRSNVNILNFARYLSDNNKSMWIRHVLVPELTDKDEYLLKLKDFIDSLKTVEKVEILPYHTLGIFKWSELNLEYTLNDIEPPSIERIENAKIILGIK